MNKKFSVRILAFLLMFVMLFSTVAMAASALDISAPNKNGADKLYSIELVDGVLKINLFPEAIYNIIKDGRLTQDEILSFIPADVLDALQNGNTSLDDLSALAANYITPDDISNLAALLPAEILEKYFTVEMLLNFVTVEELLTLLPVERIIADVSPSKLSSLLSDEALRLIIRQDVLDVLLASDLMDTLLANPDFVAQMTAEDSVKDDLYALIDEVVNNLLADATIGNNIIAYIESAAVLEKLITNDKVIAYFISQDQALTELFTNVIAEIIKKDYIKEAIFDGDFVNDIIDSEVLTLEKLERIFTYAQLTSFIKDDTFKALFDYTDFLTGILDDTALVEKLLEDDQIFTFLAATGAFNHVLIGVTDPEEFRTHLTVAEIKAALTNNLVRDILYTEAINKIDYSEYSSHINLKTTVSYETFQSLFEDEFFVDGVFSDVALMDKLLDQQILLSLAATGKFNDLLVGVTNVAELKNLITPAVIKAEMSNTSIKNIICDAAYTKTEISEYKAYINLKAFFANVDIDKFVDFLQSDSDILTALISELTASTVISIIGYDKCAELFGDNFEDLFRDSITLIDITSIDAYSISKIIEALGGYDSIITDDLLNADEFLAVIGGYDVLISFLDVNKVIDIMGRDNILDYIINNIALTDIIDNLGGFNAFISMYSMDEIVAIFEAIDPDALQNFFDDPEIKALVDYKQLTLDTLELAKSKPTETKELLKLLAKQALAFLFTEVDGIYLNDRQIYENNGEFSLTAIVIELLKSIPSLEAIINAEDGVPFAGLTLSADIGDERYSLAIEIAFVGNPEKLQNLVRQYSDFYKLDISDDLEIDLELNIPKEFSTLYTSLLESDETSPELKGKLIDLTSMTLGDVRTILEELTDEELESIVNTINAQIDKIKPATDTLGTFGIEDKVDEVLAYFTTVEGLKELISKVTGVWDKIPESLIGTKLSDFYLGNGSFNNYAVFAIDLFELINKYVTIPEDIIILFGDNGLNLSGSFNVDVAFKNLNELQMVGPDGTVYSAFLPAGTSLDVLKYSEIFGDFAASGFMDEDLNEITVMPENDLKVYSAELYTITFEIEGTIIERIIYTEGTSDISAPEIPPEYYSDEYTYVWETFTLNTEKRLIVNATKKYPEPTDFEVNFYIDGVKVKTITLPKDTTIIPAADFPAFSAYVSENNLKWYDYSWPTSYTLSNDGENNISATRTKKRFSITFKEGTFERVIWFDVDGIEPGQQVPTDADVPEKTGHKSNGWKTYDITSPLSKEVGAIYEAKTYTATFKNANGGVEATLTFTFGDEALPASSIPTVPARRGYENGVWANYVLGADDIEITPVYDLITYNITFKAGETDYSRTFTVENAASFEAPAFPARAGYHGAWKTYDLDALIDAGTRNYIVNAEYTAITYTYKFVADGVIVKEGTFTLENPKIDEPSVPAKSGFTGAWKAYTIGAADLVIEANYTAVTTPEEPSNNYWILWLILGIIFIIIIIVAIIYLAKNKGKEETPPPAPEPKPEPKPEPTPVVAPKPKKVFVPAVAVESVTEAEADNMMTDEDALEAVEYKQEKTTPGPKAIINIQDISDNFAAGDIVTLEELKAKKLVPEKSTRIKILSDGRIDKPLTIEADSFSIQAIKMITLTGGKVIQKGE